MLLFQPSEYARDQPQYLLQRLRLDSDFGQLEADAA